MAPILAESRNTRHQSRANAKRYSPLSRRRLAKNALLRPSMRLSEIVYFPMETELLKAARDLGCPTMDGGMMAVGQAVGAFELFTRRKADASRMEAHFRRLPSSV